MTRDAGPERVEFGRDYPCPACGGRRTEHTHHWTKAGGTTPCPDPCPRCDGRGTIRRVVGPRD